MLIVHLYLKVPQVKPATKRPVKFEFISSIIALFRNELNASPMLTLSDKKSSPL